MPASNSAQLKPRSCRAVDGRKRISIPRFGLRCSRGSAAELRAGQRFACGPIACLLIASFQRLVICSLGGFDPCSGWCIGLIHTSFEVFSEHLLLMQNVNHIEWWRLEEQYLCLPVNHLEVIGDLAPLEVLVEEVCDDGVPAPVFVELCTLIVRHI